MHSIQEMLIAVVNAKQANGTGKKGEKQTGRQHGNREGESIAVV
jgi:hypothetical protein